MIEAFSLINLIYCIVGVFFGTLVGILPGIGPALFITILVPFILTIGNDVTALIFMAAVFYGSQYGGSTSAILMNFAGEPSSIPTIIAGKKLLAQGRAQEALVTAAVASFIAGIISIVLIISIAPILAKIAISFTPIEFFWCLIFTIILSIFASGKNLILNIAFCSIAFVLGTLGTDTFSYTERNTFGIEILSDGIKILLVISTVFGLNEIISNYKNETSEIYNRVTNKVSTWKILLNKKVWLPSLKGTAIGAICGLLPGVGTVLASNISYSIEANSKKDKDLELIAAPESANNAAAQVGFLPLLLLGIPSTFMMVVVYGVLLMLSANSTFVISATNLDPLYIIAGSMVVGNIALLLLNANLASVWIKVLKVPRTHIFSIVVFLLAISLFDFNNNFNFMIMAVALTFLGLIMKSFGVDVIAFITTFLLSSNVDSLFQRSMIINENNLYLFFNTPTSCFIVFFGLLLSWWIYKINSKGVV